MNAPAFIGSGALRTRIILPTYHKDQARAFWAMSKSRFKALRCGRRWGKTDFAKTWILDGLARGYPCAWYAPQHKTWSEAYSEMVDHISPMLEAGSSKGGAVMRSSTNGRLDFWSLENPLAGRGRHYRRVVVDETAFAKDGDNTDDSTMMSIWEKVIKATLFDYGGEALLCSNSHGKNANNFFYNVCTDPKYGFAEYHAPTHNNDRLPKRMPGESPAQWLARRQSMLDDLKNDNDPLVFAQEYLAEFVDWSGAAFFAEGKWLVDQTETHPGRPLTISEVQNCQFVVATIDTAIKSGQEHDGTAVIYWAYDPFRKPGRGKLVMLDWDIVQVDGAFLDTWLKTVFQQLDYWATQVRPVLGSIGAFIEDKGSGITLLQEAKNKNWPAHPVDSGFTAMGKDERAISVSGYHYRGEVKMLDVAWEKQVSFKRHARNHAREQITSYRIADPDAAKRSDDLADCYMSGISVTLGNPEGF